MNKKQSSQLAAESIQCYFKLLSKKGWGGKVLVAGKACFLNNPNHDED